MDLDELADLAHEIEARQSYRDAEARATTFGELHEALGIAEADYREFWRLFARQHHTAARCLAWVEAGKPAVRHAARGTAAEAAGPRDDFPDAPSYRAAVAYEMGRRRLED